MMNPPDFEALSNSVYQADPCYKLIQFTKQTQEYATKATADAREAQSDRDRALELLESIKSKVTCVKSTIVSQEETIAHLRQRVTQLEDQSRRWEEQYLRAEQDRRVLAIQIDLLLAKKSQGSVAPSGTRSSTDDDSLREDTAEVRVKEEPGSVEHQDFPSMQKATHLRPLKRKAEPNNDEPSDEGEVKTPNGRQSRHASNHDIDEEGGGRSNDEHDDEDTLEVDVKPKDNDSRAADASLHSREDMPTGVQAYQ
ncbi:hypothetical protein DXG03_008557 [Asterophora parasitica]|uniref:Uncharacterized protein n=1 Tax=Asterophora parasitica TaxID=117018 RepID=A0A9P7FYN1_9AGAR|nr:hypothetical protein DXG03_008557 [Asterophora parasitica]